MKRANINKEDLPYKYWSIQAYMEMLQRFIIVHSIIYYNLDSNCISDKAFDNISRQLVKLQQDNPKTYRKSYYYHIMKDFDGTTGFDLYDKLNKRDKQKHLQIAQAVLNQSMKG